jgi:hypothetical protein
VEIPDYRRLDGVEVTNQDGEKLGRVDGLFVDNQVNVPTWIAVGSGRQYMHLGEVDRVGTASGEPVRPV